MERPLNEYHINCAKNIYKCNFDTLTIDQISGQ